MKLLCTDSLPERYKNTKTKGKLLLVAIIKYKSLLLWKKKPNTFSQYVFFFWQGTVWLFCFGITPEKEPQGAHVSQVHTENSTQLFYSQNLLLLFPSHDLRLTALREGVAVQTGGGACRVSHGLITHLPENKTIIIFHPTQYNFQYKQ